MRDKNGKEQRSEIFVLASGEDEITLVRRSRRRKRENGTVAVVEVLALVSPGSPPDTFTSTLKEAE